MIICNKPFVFWKRLFHKFHTIRYVTVPTGLRYYYVQDLKEDLPDYCQTILNIMRSGMNKAGLNGK